MMSTMVRMMKRVLKRMRILTMPPRAKTALYWRRVWLKMQRKGMTPAIRKRLLAVNMVVHSKY